MTAHPCWVYIGWTTSWTWQSQELATSTGLLDISQMMGSFEKLLLDPLAPGLKMPAAEILQNGRQSAQQHQLETKNSGRLPPISVTNGLPVSIENRVPSSSKMDANRFLILDHQNLVIYFEFNSIS